MGFTFKYRSPHDPEDADGDLPENDYSAGDYPQHYYAQVLLAVDTSGAPDYPYLALRIEPDRMSFVHYDGETVHELDGVAAETVANTWYTVEVRPTSGGPGDGALSIQRKSPSDGDPVALVLSTPLPEIPNVDRDAIGFTVGEDAEYEFDLVEFTTTLGTNETFVDWTYDAYGRKVARTVYDDTSMLSQTLYQWDGWRLLAEVDGLTGETLAEYIHGPAYVDDIVASFRDLDGDGDFGDANEQRYHLTDQQHSAVALLDTSGDVIERYGYDAFGAPSFYNGAGTSISESAVGNHHLYTGREYLPELGAFDLACLGIPCH